MYDSLSLYEICCQEDTDEGYTGISLFVTK